MWKRRYLWYIEHVEVRGALCEVSSILPASCGIQGSNSSPQAYKQVLYPSCHPVGSCLTCWYETLLSLVDLANSNIEGVHSLSAAIVTQTWKTKFRFSASMAEQKVMVWFCHPSIGKHRQVDPRIHCSASIANWWAPCSLWDSASKK